VDEPASLHFAAVREGAMRVITGTCHTIPGIYTARGVVGPPLYFFGRRTMVAGELPNTPENLVRWLRNPPGVEPGTAMPNLGLSDQQAQDIAAYLYTLQ
jgi:cytochrome c